MKVKDVEEKRLSGIGHVFTRDQFKDYIEIPCLKACLYFYDLNIRTTYANCNKDDTEVYLNFDFNSLSDENKQIARDLSKLKIIKLNENIDKIDGCSINFIANLDDDVNVISNKLLTIAKKFKLQDVISNEFKISKIKFLNRKLPIPGFFFDYDKSGEIHLYYEGNNKLDEEMLLVIKNIRNNCFYIYQYMIDSGLVDIETGDVFANLELANKHQMFLERKKRKKR